MYTFACSTVHIGWVLISVKYQQVVFILFARVHMQLYSKGKASKLDKMFFFKLKLTVHWQSGYINLISGLIAVYNVDIHVCKKKPFFCTFCQILFTEGHNLVFSRVLIIDIKGRVFYFPMVMWFLFMLVNVHVYMCRV